MTENKIYLVTNRSATRVFYSLPELGIKSRDFQPGETKRISYDELMALSGIPGGNAIIRNYLLIKDDVVRDTLVGAVEPEYHMTADQVKELILRGTYDEWLDALDFAPAGVIDLIKELSIEMPLTDMNKMTMFKNKTGIDLARLIQIRQDEKAEEAAVSGAAEEQPKTRRTSAASETAKATPARRTSGSKYKVVTDTSKAE